MIASIHICRVPTVENLGSTAWACGKGAVDKNGKSGEKVEKMFKSMWMEGLTLTNSQGIVTQVTKWGATMHPVFKSTIRRG
jgi:hypothetical protein